MHSTVKMADITDGASNTFLCGEKYIDPDWYFTGQDCGDDQCWTQGWDYDGNRYTYYHGNRDVTAPLPPAHAPTRPATPTPLSLAARTSTASAMAMCDGSVHP